MFASLFGFIKKLLLIVLCFLALAVGGLFAYENPDKIAPVIYGYTLPSLSLGLYLVSLLTMGVLLGFLLSLFGNQTKQFRLKSENKRLKKQVEKES